MPQTRLMSIRETLRLMEDSIIFTLIERSRYKSSHDCLDLFRKFWNEQNSLVFKFQSSRTESKIFSEIQEKLFSFYFTNILPANCKDKELPLTSIFLKDTNILFQVSERMQQGIFVAKAKFQSEPELYQKLAKENNKKEIMRKLTNSEVEEKILFRIEEKAKQLNFLNPDFNPEVAVSFYRDCIIPLTKEIELAYLLNCK